MSEAAVAETAEAPVAPVAEAPVAEAAQPVVADTQSATTLAQDPGKDIETASPSTWPDDWRESYAGDDAKKLAQLQRFNDPKAALDSLFAAQRKISSGEVSKPLPENPTDEELAQWRESNGIPADPSGYEIELANGLVVGEADKAAVDSLIEHAHKNGLPPKAVNDVLQWYYETQDSVLADQAETDASNKQRTEDQLREEWQADYRRNINLGASILETLPAETQAGLLSARLDNGNLIGNDPEMLGFFADLARQVNPVASVVPGAGAGAAQQISDEIASLVAESANPDTRVAYFKNAGKQERLRELNAAQARIDQGR